MDAIGAAASGLAFAGTWLDTTAANIANAFTSGTARNYYRAEVPLASANAAGGVSVSGIARSAAPPSDAFEPGSPSADSRGLVTYSNVDLSVEMPNLMMASDAYQANLAVLAQAQTAYQAAIDLGQPQP
ncbi:MAG: flagellar basal body rod protein FlgC [Acidimicrobiia bacterium]